MCEIFGVSSPKSLHLNQYLEEFFRHSINHPNGWGLAMLDGGDSDIEKEPVEAIKSRYLKERMKEEISSQNMLAHIRYATIGNEKYSNCHPFKKKDQSGRTWTMVHNGTIFDYAPLEKYFHAQKGDTDSERILLYIVDQIDRMEAGLYRKLTDIERCALLDSIVVDMSLDNKLNLILYDGELTYVHANYVGSLHYLKKEGGILISTQPLSSENWQPVPLTKLHVFRNGEKIFEGTDHGHMYEDNEERIGLLYLAYANL